MYIQHFVEKLKIKRSEVDNTHLKGDLYRRQEKYL